MSNLGLLNLGAKTIQQRQKITSRSILRPMHKEILTEEQVKLLSLIHVFMKDFGLVGGKAIALQIGHRQSIDFDLFTYKEFNNEKVKKITSRCKTIFAHEFNERIFREQLAYFEDMNYSEVVKFMPGHEVTEKK